MQRRRVRIEAAHARVDDLDRQASALSRQAIQEGHQLASAALHRSGALIDAAAEANEAGSRVTTALISDEDRPAPDGG